MKNWLFLGLAILLGSWLWLGKIPASWAAPPDLQTLTPELLQDRVENPVQREGKLTLDLHEMNIDLRTENEAFRGQFYRLLQNRLQSGETVINLDLSDSVIQGDFDFQRLSLREPLYGEALFPMLGEEEQAQLKRDRRRLSELSQLSRLRLLQPTSTPLGIFLFRGGLNLAQARFQGMVTASNVFFLDTVNSPNVQFQQAVDFSESRFSKLVSFMGSEFQETAKFPNCLFYDRGRWEQALFKVAVIFRGSEFHDNASFGQAVFQQGANFSRTSFQKGGDFSKTIWRESSTFAKSTFAGGAFLAEAQFEAPVTWRQSRLEASVNLRGAIAQNQLDFGDAVFGPKSTINIADMDCPTTPPRLW